MSRHADENPTAADTDPGKPTWRAYRSRHRQHQDDAAHAEDFTPPPVIDHPLVHPGKPELITDGKSLAALVERLDSAGSFAFDTEFIGENSYYPHLCLIQAATADTVALIDPFETDDLSSWWALLADPAVEKIVHAGEQDLEPIERLTGRPPANIFDTQIAGGFAGLEYPLSLVRVVEALLDLELDAGAKFSRWDRRPLSDKQRHYAASDVRYLPAVRADIGTRLADAGNTEIARAACDELCEPGRYVNDPLTRKVKAKGVNKLPPRKRAVLNALLLWREDRARDLALPARTMLADEGVMALADGLPRDAKTMLSIKYLPRPVREQFEGEILDCITEALGGPYPPRNKPTRYDRDLHKQIVNALWDRIDTRCKARSIDTPVVTSKRELGRLVAAHLEESEPPALPITAGWRHGLLSDLTADDAIAQL